MAETLRLTRPAELLPFAPQLEKHREQLRIAQERIMSLEDYTAAGDFAATVALLSFLGGQDTNASLVNTVTAGAVASLSVYLGRNGYFE